MSHLGLRAALTTRSLLALAVLAAVLFVHALVLTDGFRLSLLTPDGPSQYFDACADALWSGRIDVDPYHIGREAFLIGDRTYGYFGVTPALLRLPLHALLPALWGHWERSMILLAVCVTVLAAASLAETARACASSQADAPATPRLLRALYLLMVGLGSTTLFLSSRPNVYHEAIAWGTALTLAGLAALASWLRAPTPLRAAMVAGLCVAAVHARMVDGLGLVLAVVVSILLPLRASPHAAVRASTLQILGLGLGVLVACGSYVGLNYAKFGMALSLPLEQNLQASAERAARTGYLQMSPRYVPANVYNYLMPWNVRWQEAVVGPVPTEALVVTSGMEYDWREPLISLTAASPALLLLAAVGLFVLLVGKRRQSAISRFWPLVIGSAASASAPLLYFAIAQRYAHDMLSLFSVLGALALPTLEQASAVRLRRWSWVLALASVWSILVWWQVGEAYRAWGAALRIAPVRDAIVLPAYERELRLHPQNVVAHSEVAFIHYQDGRVDRARFHLERALELDPRHEPSILLLARIRQVDDRAGAIQLLTQAAAASPRAIEVRGVLAALLLSAGRRNEAIEQLRVVAELDPADPRARELLARMQAP